MSNSRRKLGLPYRAGEHGCSVTIYRRRPGGNIWARVWDRTLRGGNGDYRRRSLGHQDVNRAKDWADRQAIKLREGQSGQLGQRPTLSRIFAAYEKIKTPLKVHGSQQVDNRQIECLTRFFGGQTEPCDISEVDWQRFIGARSSGAIDARGNMVPENERRPVRARPVQKDLAFLRHILEWAARRRVGNGSNSRTWLDTNPVVGDDYPIPVEINPLRPIATADRFEKVWAAAEHVPMRVTRNGEPVEVRSHTADILALVNWTGRRIGSVLALDYGDLRLERTPTAPFGRIRWRANADKMGFESTVAIRQEVRAVIDRILRERPGIGAAPLFPSPTARGVAVRKDVVDKWLIKAEEKAGVQKQKGGLWHAYRRKWATERKHKPRPDVAKAGGWRSTEALEKCYTLPDDHTILEVVLDAGELREVK